MFWERLAAASTRQRVIVLALLAAALGSLMPWFSSSTGGETLSRAGIDFTAGWMSLAAGLVGAAALLAGIGAVRLAVDEVAPPLLELAAAAICLVAGVAQWGDDVAYGLLAVLAGGAVAAVAAGLELREALAVRAARPRVIVPDPPAKRTALPPAQGALPPAGASDRQPTA